MPIVHKVIQNYGQVRQIYGQIGKVIQSYHQILPRQARFGQVYKIMQNYSQIIHAL